MSKQEQIKAFKPVGGYAFLAKGKKRGEWYWVNEHTGNVVGWLTQRGRIKKEQLDKHDRSVQKYLCGKSQKQIHEISETITTLERFNEVFGIDIEAMYEDEKNKFRKRTTQKREGEGMMIFNFFANNHRGFDGRFSEDEKYSTYAEAKQRAAYLRDLWKCEWVNVYESGCREPVMQI
jgi:hypothetical protein